MNENNFEEVRECFARFGRAVYMMQVVEKGLITSLINTIKNVSKSRYDELLSEKFQLTVGLLKRELADKKIYDDETLAKLDIFHQKRDWLAHSYWWDRVVEFDRDDLRYKILEELDDLTDEFMELDTIISKKTEEFFVENGLDLDSIMEEISSLDETPRMPNFVKLTKNETLIGVYTIYALGNLSAVIFKLLDKGYWTLSEQGLTKYDLREADKLIPLQQVQEVLPVQQFNPRPKIIREWEYELDLKKKGMCIKVWPSIFEDKFIYRWVVRQNK